MAGVFKTIRGYVSDVIEARRFVALSFGHGMTGIEGIAYIPRHGAFERRFSFVIRNASEETFYDNWRVKLILKLAFFPFRYRALLEVPHEMGRSSYVTIAIQRDRHGREAVQAQEVSAALSNYVGKFVDQNRDTMVLHTDTAPQEAVMAHSYVADVRAGAKHWYYNPDDLFRSSADAFDIGIVQTFVHKRMMEGLQNILPRRARIGMVFEDGFHLPLGVYLKKSSALRRSGKLSFGVAIVRGTQTDLFVYDGQAITFFDRLPFGEKHLYTALNSALLVGRDAFFPLLDKIANKELSPRLQRTLSQILAKEMARFVHGIKAFERSAKVPTCYVDAGEADAYMREHPFLRQRLIDEKHYAFVPGVEAGEAFPHTQRADLLVALHMPRPSSLNEMAKKSVRWLLPDVQ